MLDTYLKWVQAGISFNRDGDKLTWEAPEGGGLSPSDVAKLKECKPRILTWIEPRVDLEEDSGLWQVVLREAARKDRKTFGLLHGLRCADARLITQANGSLRLDYSAVEADMPDVRARWLLPYKTEIADVFAAAVGPLEVAA